MRFFSLLIISLLAVTAPAWAVTHPGIVTITFPIKSPDQSLTPFDERFGNMVAEAPCPVPYIFVAGTTAQASQVNANFSTLSGCLNAIYASDIVPTSLAQATFGGSLTYTFPSGVNVAGGQNNPFSTTSGPVWLTQGGNNNGSYAINFGMQACGSVGLASFWNVNISQALASFDCSGDYLNHAGSEVANFVESGNGNFTSPTGQGISVCPGGCGSGPNFNFNTNGGTVLPGTLVGSLASPIPSASPGAPVAFCYRISGAPCALTWHTVWDTVGVAVSGCTNGSVCPNVAVGITFPFAFSNTLFSCSGQTTNVGGVFTTWNVINTGQAAVQILNETGTTLTQTITVAYTCSGT